MLRQYEAGHTCLLLGLSLPIAKRQSWQSRLMGRCSWLMWFCHISMSFRSAAVKAFILGTVVLSLNGGCPRWTLIATESKRFKGSRLLHPSLQWRRPRSLHRVVLNTVQQLDLMDVGDQGCWLLPLVSQSSLIHSDFNDITISYHDSVSLRPAQKARISMASMKRIIILSPFLGISRLLNHEEKVTPWSSSKVNQPKGLDPESRLLLLLWAYPWETESQGPPKDVRKRWSGTPEGRESSWHDWRGK